MADRDYRTMETDEDAKSTGEYWTARSKQMAEDEAAKAAYAETLDGQIHAAYRKYQKMERAKIYSDADVEAAYQAWQALKKQASSRRGE